MSFLPRHSKFYVMTRSVGAFPSAPDTSEQSDAHLYPKAPASSDTTPVDESNIFLLLLLFLFWLIDWLFKCLVNCILNTSFLFWLIGQVFGTLHTYTAFLFRLIVLASCSNAYLTQLSCFDWLFKCLGHLQTYAGILSWLFVLVSCSIAYSTQFSCLYCFLFGNLRIVLLSTSSFVVWSCERQVAQSLVGCQNSAWYIVVFVFAEGQRQGEIRVSGRHGGTSGSRSVFAHSDSDTLAGFKHHLSFFP